VENRFRQDATERKYEANAMKFIVYQLTAIALILQFCSLALAQDERAQLPPVLSKSYLELDLGSMKGDYGAAQFQAVPGYTFKSAEYEPLAVRLVAGHEFNKYLSAELSYMRPISWIKYTYEGADLHLKSKSVRLNVMGLTLRPQLPVTDHFSFFGEVGVSIVTRSGFDTPDGAPLVKGADYTTLLLGGGMEYHLGDHWGLQVSALYSPEEKSAAQSALSLVTAGLSYKLLPLDDKQLMHRAETDYIHPKQWVQVGYSNNGLGYGVNNFLEDAYLFWGGDAEVRQGLTLNYQRNVYHGPRTFALDWGASASYWQSKKSKQEFYTLSVFPVFRFNLIHTRPLDAYFSYSVAGPTYISRIMIDGVDTGEHFTFQDTIGVGAFFGENRTMNAEVKIGHYSNGNIFPENDAVKVPLSINIGYAF